jgi:hypothetical protein
MSRLRFAALAVALVLIPALAFAQANANSSISGVAKDGTGAVLPGVTVEAASPALIEKVRTSVTDDQGNYRIIGLVPGTYTVTFTLTGFNTIKVESIEVSSSYNATVNADLKVGALEEAITVTGQTAAIDTQNTIQQQTFKRDLVDALPTARTMIGQYATMIPGITGGNGDVGGNKGDADIAIAIHGGRPNDMKLLVDGMRTNAMVGTSGGRGFGYNLNAAAIAETTITSAGLAEQETGGVQINAIPKEGGNTFHGQFLTNYTDHNFQNNNLTQALRDQGITNANSVDRVWDENLAVGGPIRQDRLWFFAAQRYWGSNEYIAGDYYNATQGTSFYTPDLTRQAINDQYNVDETIRATWQAAKTQRFNFAYGNQYDCFCHYGLTGSAAPEAVDNRKYGPPNYLAQATWNWAPNNKVLVEAANTSLIFDWPAMPQPEATPGTISINDTGIGLVYNAKANGYGHHVVPQSNQRASVTYVTGTHSYKAGMFLQEGSNKTDNQLANNADAIDYTFKNQVPQAVIEWATPLQTFQRLRYNFGLFAQDVWTIKRLTLQYGLRLDDVNSYVPPQHLDAGRFVPARNFAEVDCVPCFKDIEPRLGAAYTLTSDGKTALKVNFGRFVAGEGINTATANNPVQTSVNSATRTWHDDNKNFSPDCNLSNPLANGECNQINNLNFGQTNVATTYDPNILNGWGKRAGSWQTQASIEREIVKGVTVDVGYFRTSYFNFQVSDNQSIAPANYNAYTVTAPNDPRLPNGGGYAVADQYDITPTLFGVANNIIVTNANHYGKQTDVYNGIDANVRARFGNGGVFSGGISAGKEVTDNCAVVVDQPSNPFCHVSPPMSAATQVKFIVSYPIVWHLNVSSTFQNVPGANYIATWAAPQSAINGLGRSLSAGSTATATVQLLPANTYFLPRYTQWDIRLARSFKIGNVRLQGMLDAYNLTNVAPALAVNSTFGPNWLKPQSLLDGRLFKFGFQMGF